MGRKTDWPVGVRIMWIGSSVQTVLYDPQYLSEVLLRNKLRELRVKLNFSFRRAGIVPMQEFNIF